MNDDNLPENPVVPVVKTGETSTEPDLTESDLTDLTDLTDFAFAELEGIDLNQFIAGNDGDDIFITRVRKASIEAAEIFSDDLLVVNRSRRAKNGDKVVASVNGSLTVKIFRAAVRNGLRLVASNGKRSSAAAAIQSKILGVITHVVRPAQLLLFFISINFTEISYS